jgi:hypothetical protein
MILGKTSYDLREQESWDLGGMKNVPICGSDTDLDDVLAEVIGRPQSRITYPYQDPRMSNNSTFGP